MLIKISDTKKLLEWLATVLKYGKPETFRNDMTVEVYHRMIDRFEFEFVKSKFLELPYKINDMPTPREFADFFGWVIPDLETKAQLIQGQIRQAAQNNTSLAEDAKFVLTQMGVTLYDIKYNMRLLDSFTTRKIENILKTKPILEETKKKKTLEDKTKSLMSKPQEVVPTQNPANTAEDRLREQANKIIAEGTDKYMLGECVKTNNVRNPLLGKSFREVVK